MTRTLLTTAALGIFAATGATAMTTATAQTDLNLRAGPGPMYQIADVIAAADTVTVDGCLTEANWCKVGYKGTTGWAYGDYLNVALNDAVMPLSAEPAQTEIVKIEVKDESEEALLAGGMFGAAVGALIGGPITIAGAAAAGAIAGDIAAPEPEVFAYVEKHPVETVIMDGEVVVGAGIPETVPVYQVPDTQYSYLAVNGQTVVVDNATREIVTVIR